MRIIFKLRFLLATCVIGILLLSLDYFGIIWHNAPFAAQYKIKGLDVSHHQENIDWKKVAETNKYSFVYIKATEGHDFSDDDFNKNWKEAKENELLVGAYHFFSTRSTGQEQADFYISKVPSEESALPPLIDIEVDKTKDPEIIRGELNTLVIQLEQFYGKKPILYVTYDTYNAYIKGYFSNYNIWIRDVFKPASLGNRNWLFWQFNNRGRVSGINTYVDINVFNGTYEELKNLTKPITNSPTSPATPDSE